MKKKLGIQAKLNRGIPLNVAETKKYKKTLHKKAWKMMSDRVRERDNYTCFTCPTKGDKYTMDAGHFMHGSSDFDERNINTQCKKCNRYLSGNLAEYTIRMMDKYGLDVVMELRRKKHQPEIYTIKQLNEIILNLSKAELKCVEKKQSMDKDLEDL